MKRQEPRKTGAMQLPEEQENMEKPPVPIGTLKHYSRLLGLPVVIFVLFLSGGLHLVQRNDEHWLNEHDHHLGSIGQSQAISLERHLSRSLAAAFILGEQVRYQKGELSNFEELASDLITHLGGITNLQLAPNGVIERIYPLAGHEAALGHNILRDDKRKRDALKAIASADITIAGPFPLIQGGIGLVGRYPVFLQDSNHSPGSFWGFASVLIMVEELIASTQLSGLRTQGYQYRLWVQDPENADTERYQFAGDMVPEAIDRAFTTSIQLHNQTWHLDIAYLDPARHVPGRGLMLAIALGVATLAGFLAYYLVRAPERLRLEVAQKTRQLQQLAFFDQLTGLPNRQLLMDRLQQGIRLCERQGSRFALLFIDLDGFKAINDHLGHQSGDLALQEAAKRLLSCVRSSDTVARMGGDEFTVVLNDVTGDRQQLDAVARRILASLDEPLTLKGKTTGLAGSIGIAQYPEHGADAETLLKRADMAMYLAKSARRNSFRYADS